MKEQLEAKVREILLKDWDPCGVGDNPSLNDEYDEYLPEIVAVLEQSGTNTAIDVLGLLSRYETELGVSLPEEQRNRVVVALVAL